MFSSKTTLLISQKKPGKTLWIKHTTDSRYSDPSNPPQIITHDGLKQDCVSVEKLSSLTIDSATKYINIDEVHFFTDLLIVNNWAEKGIHVTMAGLISNHKMEMFQNIQPILSKVDEIIFLQGTCQCGAPSSFSKRLVQTEKEFYVGGSEAYASSCRQCFNL